MWYVYFLKSDLNNHHYIGVTENYNIRLKQHNQGKTKSTKPYRPWHIIYTEEFTDKLEAYKREYWLKHPRGYQDKLNIVARYG